MVLLTDLVEDMVVVMEVMETMGEIMVEGLGFILAMVDMGMGLVLEVPCMVVPLDMDLAVMEPLVVMALLLGMGVVVEDMEVCMMVLRAMGVVVLLEDMVVAAAAAVKGMVPEVVEAMVAKDMEMAVLQLEGSIPTASKTSLSPVAEVSDKVKSWPALGRVNSFGGGSSVFLCLWSFFSDSRVDFC